MAKAKSQSLNRQSLLSNKLPAGASTMRYRQCKKADLINFAANRGLQVTSKFPKGPYHREYAAALEQADRDATFRFLDLPTGKCSPLYNSKQSCFRPHNANRVTELRNWIYEDLLTLQDSFSCFPQILRTSREVHAEATSILYSENYIDVKIYPDGVYAHGRRCGSYVPVTPTWNTLDQDFTTITWPDFLLRARFLRLMIPNDNWNRPGARRDRREDSVGNTIYSLCQTVRASTQLRSLRMVMQPDTTTTFESMQYILYPLRLLTGVHLDLIDDAGESLMNFYPQYNSFAVAPTGILARLKLVYECISHASTLDGRSRTLARGQVSNWPIYGLIQATVSSAQGWNEAHDCSLPIWLSAFHAAIQHLRKKLETRWVWRSQIDPAVLLSIYALLRMDVDLSKCSRPKGAPILEVSLGYYA